jgi:hypothetical protein
MKKLSILFVSALLLVSCKNATEEKVDMNETEKETSIAMKETADYPAPMQAVFEAHGTMAEWNKMHNLCFEMDGKNGNETHTISLHDRRSKIETKDWSIGYNGDDVWLLENDPGSYKGNARFYHNLMFYFYAMPFVLGDDGIQYKIMPLTELDGTNYKGVKVSYEAGVGDSPKDEYILYFHPDTNQMEWLGYTVTFGKDATVDDWHFIKYDEWTEVNGLLLPKKLTWYNVEDGKPTDERNDLRFKKITVTETTLEDSVFEKPESAVVVEMPEI